MTLGSVVLATDEKRLKLCKRTLGQLINRSWTPTFSNVLTRGHLLCHYGSHKETFTIIERLSPASDATIL